MIKVHRALSLIETDDSVMRGNFPVIGCSGFFKIRCEQTHSECHQLFNFIDAAHRGVILGKVQKNNP